jgi:predicted GIY-YIG superfamily endonuclease
VAATSQPLWFVYILLCRDGAYYVGCTHDLERRMDEHFAGRGGHYTRCNPPIRLLYQEGFPKRAAAEARERQLKGWTRAKKAALIAGDPARLKAL